MTGAEVFFCSRPRRRRKAAVEDTGAWAAESSEDRAARERQLLALCHSEMRERDLERVVIGLFALHGWRHHHTTDSRRSARGFPDWTAAQVGRYPIFVELKTTKGRLRKEQQLWLDILGGCTGVLAGVVRPADMPAFNAFLKGERQTWHAQ